MVEQTTAPTQNPNISPAGSWRGYTLTVAIKRNKDLIKTELAIIGGLNLMPPFDWKMLLLTSGIGLFVFITKMAADFVDFVATDVDLTKK